MKIGFFSPLYGMDDYYNGHKFISFIKFAFSEFVQSGLWIFILIKVFRG
jgi:hypothetical protein